MNIIHVKFDGWFQSRFATNPDPSDDPRGTRGFSRTLPDEPDFDRIIRFQMEGTYMRSYIAQEIGVTVKAVFDNTGNLTDHPLLKARVDLLDSPVFKGENGIVAEDGLEPIVPFILNISNHNLEITRSSTTDPPKMPFSDTRPSGSNPAPGKIASRTGIYDYKYEMERRIQLLQNELQTPSVSRRIKLIKDYSLRGPGFRLFNYSQDYYIELKGSATLNDPFHIMKQKLDINNIWIVEFWMGGWDIDAQCGFIEGYLSIPKL